MLEIIGIILLCNVNKKNAVALGKSGGGAVGMTIGLWIGLEMVGALIGTIAELGVVSYVLALVFGIIGGVLSYFIAKSPAKHPSAPTPAWPYGQQGTNAPPPPVYASTVPQTAPQMSAPAAGPHQAPAKFCTRCGRRLEAGVRFCSACGTSTGAGGPIAATPAPAAPAASAPAAPTVIAATPTPAMSQAAVPAPAAPAAPTVIAAVPAPAMSQADAPPNPAASAPAAPAAAPAEATATPEPPILPSAAIIEPLMSGAPAPCAHKFRHFVCEICGEPAPKPTLPSKGIRKQGNYTYEDYSAKSAEEARCFLGQTPVTAPLYYVMVHTPEGEWGRDKDGMFLSGMCGFQRDLSLRQCDAVTALMPERLADLQLAANGVTDNYLLGITCGECGVEWIDGVGYRAKTIVRCPDCGRYNLADTGHIRFNAL